MRDMAVCDSVGLLEKATEFEDSGRSADAVLCYARLLGSQTSTAAANAAARRLHAMARDRRLNLKRTYS
jgi:hypothetical protein